MWREFKSFFGINTNNTYFFARWLCIRAIGLLYVIVFSGVLSECKALIGPNGIAPLETFFKMLVDQEPFGFICILHAPSLFWLSSNLVAINVVGWCGIVAAVALTLNIYPRIALFICYIAFLSFVATGHFFVATQMDQLILETAFLFIFFAPSGFRPGLGLNQAPNRAGFIAVKWLLIRLMLEPGIFKFTSGNHHWLDFTAMDVMYETTPFPTFLGYIDHHLPHVYHVFEYILTFAAELVAPLIAIFGGKAGRWVAFVIWTIFQIGIELTNNFGWLNVTAIALGILLLDDQMLLTVLDRCKITYFKSHTDIRSLKSSKMSTLRNLKNYTILFHSVLTLYFFVIACDLSGKVFPSVLVKSLNSWFSNFHTANAYPLFQGFPEHRFALEFEGSNDQGKTWRVYPFKYQPQRLDQICPFIAPRFPRFEATLQITLGAAPNAQIYPVVASYLLARNTEVISLFKYDPFLDSPPTMIRMPVYLLKFTDYSSYLKTGNYWQKEYQGVYTPMLYVDTNGRILQER